LKNLGICNVAVFHRFERRIRARNWLNKIKLFPIFKLAISNDLPREEFSGFPVRKIKKSLD
jgi:hypothetical protein